MKFEFDGEQYDLRWRAEYLPVPFRSISKANLDVLLTHAVAKVTKQTLMNAIHPGALIL